MHSFDDRDLRPRPSPRRARACIPLKALALCAIALAAIALTASVVIAASDPDWIGTAPTNVSQSEVDRALLPAIAAGPGGQVVVVWNDLSPGESKPDIYVTHSDDNGESWHTPMQVLETVAKSQLPDVVVAEGRIFVAWSEESDKTFTIHEAELGSDSRSIPIPETDAPSDISTGPRLAAGPDRLHVVFNAGQQDSHIFHSSRHPGAAWPEATRIYASPEGSLSWFPALAVSPDGEDLHVVWERLSAEGRSVWYMYGTAAGSGVSWASPLKLSANIASVKPDVATSSSGDIHVVWGEADAAQNSYYVRYRRYDASRKIWLDVKRVDPRPVYVNQISPTESTPRLALWEDDDRGNLCVTWHGFREGGAEDALLSCSQDGGETWQPARTMSTLPEGIPEYADISIWPSITFDGSGTLHGVWQQRVDITGQGSSYEIYYAHAMNCVFLPLVIRSG